MLLYAYSNKISATVLFLMVSMDTSVTLTLPPSDVRLTVMLGEFEFGGSGLVIVFIFLVRGFRCFHLSAASMFYLSI